MPLLSMRQYAKHRGVSPEAVSKAVKAGRITCKFDDRGRAQIDPEVADREWEANTDHSLRPGSAQENVEKLLAEALEQKDEFEGLTVAKAAAILKEYQARMAKLEFDEKAGQLHDIEECKRNSFKRARATRDALLGIPDRLSAELAGETDQFEIRTRLDAEIRKALENLATEIEGME